MSAGWTVGISSLSRDNNDLRRDRAIIWQRGMCLGTRFDIYGIGVTYMNRSDVYGIGGVYKTI